MIATINLDSLPNYRFRDRKLAAEFRTKAAALVRMMKAPRVKAAAGIGGDQEASFEQAFASLAYTYLRDKAPRLLDYMLGFQLVDRDNDKTKAVGIFGFKIGQQWLYAPVFFLNGQMKGHELLFIKGQDQFVPMKENWVNFVLAQRPHVLGEQDPRTLQQMGVLQPNLYRLSTPPHSTKFGSVQVDLPGWKPWAIEFAPTLGSLLTEPTSTLTKYAGLDEALDLRNVLKQDLALCKAAMDAFRMCPAVAATAERFYGPHLLRDSLLSLRKTAALLEHRNVLGAVKNEQPLMKVSNILRGPEPVVNKKAAGPKVEIKVNEDEVTTQNAPELTEQERERLMRDGHLIKDHREGEEVSKKYNTQVMLELANPDNTGIYDMLVKPGGFARCLVISRPWTSEGTKDFSTVVRLDPKDWINAHKLTLFAKPKLENEEGDWAKWFDKQTNADLSEDGVYVIVGRNGDGTAPFRVNEDVGGGRYKVWFKDYASRSRPSTAPAIADSCRDWDSDYSYGSAMIALNDRDGTQFKNLGNILYIPTDRKILKVEKSWADKQKDKDKGDSACVPCGNDSQSETPPIQPGSLADVQAEILRKSAQLKLAMNGSEVSINSGRLMPKRSALFSLVRDYGFREKDARDFLADAETARIKGKPAIIRVKYAEGYPSLQPGPGAPAINEPQFGSDPAYGGVTTQYPQEETQPIPELMGRNTDPGIYNPLPEALPPDPMAMQAAQQAGQQGQKEVFDASMLAGLIRTSRQDNMVQRYLGDLLRALDRLGRLLFVFYWHNDEMADQYGKAELPELEDALRNTFESLGDVVLFIKEKDAGLPGLQFQSPELSAAADV